MYFGGKVLKGQELVSLSHFWVIFLGVSLFPFVSVSLCSLFYFFSISRFSSLTNHSTRFKFILLLVICV